MCFSALTSSFAQNKNIKDLYEQLDQAIKQSQYYINQKESRIKNQKQSRQGHTPQQLLTAYTNYTKNTKHTKATLLFIIFTKPSTWQKETT